MTDSQRVLQPFHVALAIPQLLNNADAVPMREHGKKCGKLFCDQNSVRHGQSPFRCKIQTFEYNYHTTDGFQAFEPDGDSSAWKKSRPAKGRWIPLSLRTLMALLLTGVVALAWMGMRIYRQGAEIQELEQPWPLRSRSP